MVETLSLYRFPACPFWLVIRKFKTISVTSIFLPDARESEEYVVWSFYLSIFVDLFTLLSCTRINWSVRIW